MQKSAKLHFCTDIPIQYRYRKIKSVITALNSQVIQNPRQTYFDMKQLSSIPTLPLLQTAQGNFTQANTIIRYLASKANYKLYGQQNNIYQRSLIDQWLDITLCDIDTCVIALNIFLQGKQVDIQQVTHDIQKYLTFLNKHLKNKKYIVGEKLTIADLAIAATIGPVLANMFGEEERKKYGILTTWYLNIAKQNKQIQPKELPKKIHKKFQKKDHKQGKQGKQGKNKQQTKDDKGKKQKGQKGDKKQGKQTKQGKQGKEGKQKTKGGQQKDKKKKQQKQQQPQKKQQDDLFGDDTSTPAPAQKQKQKKPQQKKQAKKKPAAKSIIIFNVKVFQQQQNLSQLSQKIKKQIQMDGIVWNNDIQIKPIAFGMNMLEMGCVIQDEKVSVEEDIYNKILSWETQVQSVDTVSFQKL